MIKNTRIRAGWTPEIPYPLKKLGIKKKKIPLKSIFYSCKAERMRPSEINSNVICHRNPQIRKGKQFNEKPDSAKKNAQLVHATGKTKPSN